MHNGPTDLTNIHSVNFQEELKRRKILGMLNNSLGLTSLRHFVVSGMQRNNFYNAYQEVATSRSHFTNLA